MIPIVAAWDAAGRPEPNWQGKATTTRTAPAPRPGVCALTGIHGDVYDHRHVVSDSFTAWDRLPFRHVDPDGVAFSAAAAWAFRLRVATQRPHGLIDGRWGELDPPGLLHALHRVGPGDFVCVPQSRQKHLLPWARPGAVQVDDETLRWANADVTLLDLYGLLRDRGFGETALAEREPRWPILMRLDPDDRRDTIVRWHLLDRWRAHPAYLDVAARATRTVKEVRQ